MSVMIRIPTPLRNFTGGAAEVAVEARTVEDAFHRLAEVYPDLRRHLYNEAGQLRNFVNAYLNADDVRRLNGGKTAVADGDTITIVPSIAGGRGAVAGALSHRSRCSATAATSSCPRSAWKGSGGSRRQRCWWWGPAG
jgi:molybdopterin converting factor small subunit